MIKKKYPLNKPELKKLLNLGLLVAAIYRLRFLCVSGLREHLKGADLRTFVFP